MLQRHLISVVLLLVLGLTFFAPIHLSGDQLIATDTVQWRAMAESMIEVEEETGAASLWAGRVFAGMPGYMISPELTVPQVDVLMRELRLLIWPTSHMWLLLIGMYFLAFRLTRESFSACLAAVVYGFTTYIPVILAAGHNSKYIAMAWAPWMLLAFLYALQKRSVVSALLFAIALASNLRAGHVQITYYVTIAAGIWWLVEGIHAARSGGLTSFLRGTGMLALGSVLGLMMVAQPYLSHAELTPFTTRGSSPGGGAGGMAWDYAMAWSQGASEMLTLLIADAFGGASPTYWGAKTFTGGPHHLGVIAILMGAIAFWKVRDRETLSLSIAIVVMIMFALGENLAIVNRPMFAAFPLFSAFRVPETWLAIVSLLAALLAARGLVSVRHRNAEKTPIKDVSWIRIAGGLGALLLILNVFGTSILSFEKPQEREQIVAQLQSQYPGISPADPQVMEVVNQELSRRAVERIDVFNADARRALIVLLAGVLLLFLYYRRVLPYWLVAVLLVLIVSMDLTGIARRHINERRLSPSPSVEQSVPRYAFDDFLIGQKNATGGEGSFRVLSLEFGRHPVQNARPSYFYESLGGYSGAKLRLYQDYLDDILFAGPSGLNTAALRMLDVRYLVAGGGAPGFNLVFKDEDTGMSVFENPGVLGRAFLVDSVAVAPDPETMWQELDVPTFNPGRTAWVYDASQLPNDVLQQGGSGSGDVRTASYSAEDMTFEVDSDRSRLLVISEIYYPPGWTASVNGEETAIIQVNHLLRGVAVPAGSSTVELTFAPPAQRNGILITAVGASITYGLLLVFGLLAFRRRKKEEGVDEEAE